MYKIVLSKSSEKFIKNSEKILLSRILNKIEKLKENPFPSDCKRVEGQTGKVFRVRIGDYRILYEILQKEVIIQIIKIDKREGVYD